MAEIALHNLSKTYDPGLFKKKVKALKDLSLEVAPGEVFGLIGPNGAGKSTTIRLILGLSRPDTGKILFRGQPPKGETIQRETGYLPENPYLYDHLTLRELLAFCGRVSGLAPQVCAARRDELLAKVAMSEFQNRPLRTFSKGMLQRAGICFALLHDPSVVILDEPMSGLDPLGRKIVFDLVMELKEQGKTIFFCSHILSDVERLCDRIGILVQGRLVRELSHGELLEQTRSEVNLVLSPLNEKQQAALESGPGGLSRRGSEIIYSLPPEELASAMERLSSLDVRVLATRGEKISLEELFIQTIEEHAA
ncbi:ABC transporter ATP-binding protein [Geoalkalibacter halelectricus]|uniref:ABC transporter ATP-binding protein n=1 Tax=Geoalkalibacter halelectricus TaxID=2847045 RepID=A0ABY5ZUE8_9BACT|nr:ABC transporter ATP-binding protein [Geoalkalibacter halelectricus]MDO3376775.1 ABC transporter ATP-binding protein [Geoalkalibacter halelectricus]UWZ81274.1 ABC transporter ATP-binding protein [Geoalkalibacter halelectricus]